MQTFQIAFFNQRNSDENHFYPEEIRHLKEVRTFFFQSLLATLVLSMHALSNQTSSTSSKESEALNKAIPLSLLTATLVTGGYLLFLARKIEVCRQENLQNIPTDLSSDEETDTYPKSNRSRSDTPDSLPSLLSIPEAPSPQDLPILQDFLKSLLA